MKVLIAGQKWFAVELLEQVVKAGHEVVAVTAPSCDDRLIAEAKNYGINTFLHRDKVIAATIPTGVDIILTAHLHAILTRPAWQKTKYGALGYHPSLLPRHRGRDAVRWAVHMREPVTGGTIFWLDDGMDTGAIAAQDWCHIRVSDTAQELWRRDLAPMGLRLFMEVLSKIERGEMPRKQQDESLATFEPGFPKK